MHRPEDISFEVTDTNLGTYTHSGIYVVLDMQHGLDIQLQVSEGTLTKLGGDNTMLLYGK